MKAQSRKVPYAVALAIPRADGPMPVAVLAVAVTTAVAAFAILAAGWQLGELVLRMMGRA